MRKRLTLKKITLRNLDSSALEKMAGGATVGACSYPGCLPPTMWNCGTGTCNTCAQGCQTLQAGCGTYSCYCQTVTCFNCC
jgi:hypothetical protein